MAVKRRTQIQAKAQAAPGTAATGFAGSDVVDVYNAEFTESRPLLDRQTASRSLSNSKKAVGAGSSTMTYGVDWRGGRTDGVPDFDVPLQACGLYSAGARTITLDGGGELSSAIRAGDILQGDTSGARCMTIEDAAASDGSFRAIILTPDTAFSASDNLDNLTTEEDGVGGYASDAAIAGAAGYHPVSEHRLQMTLNSGTWTGDTPAVGDGVTFASSGVAVGGGIILSLSGTTLVVEMGWGTASASNTITATGFGAAGAGTSGTNALHATPAFAQTMWPYITLRHNEHNFQRVLEGALGTFSVTAEAGGAFEASMEFLGKKDEWGEEQFLTSPTRNSKLPPRLLKTGNAAFTLNGIRVPLVSLEFSAGMETNVSRDGNQTEGVYRTEGSARNPTISLTVQRVPTSTFNWEQVWQTGASNRIALRADGGTNNGIMLLAPNTQIANVSHGEDSGLSTDTYELELAGTVDDDEFVLFFGTI